MPPILMRRIVRDGGEDFDRLRAVCSSNPSLALTSAWLRESPYLRSRSICDCSKADQAGKSG